MLQWKSSKAAIRKQLQAFERNMFKMALLNLTYLAEQCVNHARTNGSYRDGTGNLRNSVGYVIIYNGRVLKKDFQKSSSVAGGGTKRDDKGRFVASANGVREGERYALDVAKNYPQGLVLIVVAGMSYAAKVESNGKDVLTSAEQLAEKELPRMLRDLKVALSAF